MCIQSNFCPVEEIGEAINVIDVQGTIPSDFPAGVYIRNGMCDQTIILFLDSFCLRFVINRNLTSNFKARILFSEGLNQQNRYLGDQVTYG